MKGMMPANDFMSSMEAEINKLILFCWEGIHKMRDEDRR